MPSSNTLAVGGVTAPGYPPMKHFQEMPVYPATASSSVSPSQTPRPLISIEPSREAVHVGREDMAPEALPVPSQKALGKRRAQNVTVVDVTTTNSPPRPSKRARGEETNQNGKKGQKGTTVLPKSKGETTKTTTTAAPATRRVQPPRSRRGGPGIGSSAVDVMILESHQRAAQNKYTIEPDAVFTITTDPAQIPSASPGEHDEPHESYFDRPEVQREYKKQATIQTPEFSLLEEHSAVGSRLRARAILEDVVDTSDPVYERRHRKYETFEKRQRFREKEKLQYEHFKLRERMDELKVMDIHSFDRIQGMDDVPPEDRKRMMLKEGEELDQRYAILLNDKKGTGVSASGNGKRKGLGDERTESDLAPSDVGSRIRLRLKRGKTAVEPEPEPEVEQEVTPEQDVGSDEEREAGEVELAVGMDVVDDEGVENEEDDDAGDKEEPEADDDDGFPSPRRRAPSKSKKRYRHSSPTRNRKSTRHASLNAEPCSSSPPPDLRHQHASASAHSKAASRAHHHPPNNPSSSSAMPILLQAALKSKAQPNAKRRQAPRGDVAFGVSIPTSFLTPAEYELPRWILRDVEYLRGDDEEEEEDIGDGQDDD
ncbi:hypothetical protein FRB94_005414 [Tulasnella sp. JGI-2019a]|nr:hypothetical protein FRB94_005414 [Tulasnella sp. JGI-2019a]